MESLKKGSFDPMKLIGMIFAGVGVGLLLTGAGLFFVLMGAHIEFFWLPSVIMCGIGLIFLALGVSFLTTIRRRRETEQELKSRGDVVYADVTGVNLNYSVSINGRHPYVVEASYRDPFSGTVHMFHSKNLRFDPTGYVQGKKVPIYSQGSDFGKYFMDVDSILPEVEIH